jgi:GDSL-like Lipase/Acylhydrolase family
VDCFININNPRRAIIFSKYSAWLSYICSTSVLCFTLLFLVSCNSSPTGQPGGHTLQLQQAPRARLTYVAIGASDTFGLGADDPQTQSWPDDLAMKLGSGVRLVNLGVPGITLHQALSVEVPIAIDAHPNLVTIWLAVNDLANVVPIANYTHDLDLLVSRVQRANIHHIFTLFQWARSTKSVYANPGLQ